MPRLLLVKLGAIGDVIMAIPAAHSMHTQGYHVDWVCGTTVAPLLRLYSWINVIPVDELALLRGSPWVRAKEVLRLWRQLGFRRYDLCATLYYDARLRLLTLPVRAATRISLSPLDRSRQLLPGRHHTDEFARILLQKEDGETPLHLAPISFPAPDADFHHAVLSRTSLAARIVLFPAGARNALRDDNLRRWPLDSYVELAAVLLRRGYEVVLAGGLDDRWASLAFSSLQVTDRIGNFNLPEILAELAASDVVVTHDTGPLHIAGITSAAIVSIFGPTDPHGRLPQRPNSIAIWGGENFACRPCYDGHEFAPCAHNGCIREVSSAMVLEQVEILLSARREGVDLPPQILVPASPATEPAHLINISPTSVPEVSGANRS
jgi:heptosyltransferase-2